MSGRLYYQVVHERMVRRINTDICVKTDEWCEKRQRIVVRGGRAAALQGRIDGKMAVLKSVIGRLESDGKAYTADDVVRLFRSSEGRASVFAFMNELIDALRGCNRLGTAKNYEHAMQSFMRFTGGDLPMEAITERLIDSYNAYLFQRGVVRNSASFYMRILRAVYNKAVGCRMVEQSNPFRNVYTGIDKTCKRAVDEKIIGRLYGLKLTSGSRPELARDMFIFSYCTRGMAFVDVAYLRKSDIRHGVIQYVRRKTKQLLTVRMEPGIESIIERYAGTTEGSPYVFPILTTTEPAAAYRQYRTAINFYNRQLKELSAMVSADCRLTSYTARHSWATAARKHNAPLAVISAGLGHTSEKTTQIYLASLEDAAIDVVNREIIENLGGQQSE